MQAPLLWAQHGQDLGLGLYFTPGGEGGCAAPFAQVPWVVGAYLLRDSDILLLKLLVSPLTPVWLSPFLP